MRIDEALAARFFKTRLRNTSYRGRPEEAPAGSSESDAARTLPVQSLTVDFALCGTDSVPIEAAGFERNGLVPIEFELGNHCRGRSD
jgi:hypothetical protein